MSSFKRGLVVSGLSIIVLGVGCTVIPQAREVTKKPTGGIIALNTSYTPEDRGKADSLMRSNCAGREVKITEEGEVTVGTRTNAQENTSVDQNMRHNGWGWSTGPSVNKSGTTETHDIKEWRITYECVAREAVKTEKKKKG